MWNVVRTNKFSRDYKNLSHEARTRCDEVILELAASPDPRALAYGACAQSKRFLCTGLAATDSFMQYTMM